MQIWQMPWINGVLKNPILLWAQRKGWFEFPNPFGHLQQRQFVERKQYWQDRKGQFLDKHTLLDSMLKIQQDNPEATDFEPEWHSMSLVGGSNDSM